MSLLVTGADATAAERELGSGVYPLRGVALVRGENARVWDAEGREYLDLAAGHGVANLGHAHPVVTAAVREQAGRLVTCPQTFANDARAALYRQLLDELPGPFTRVFLCNSGTEAVEAALKFARLSTGRPGLVAAMRGFHGRTMGALALTWERKYKERLEPHLPGVAHVPYGNLDAARERVGDATAAVVVEIVQGEGGVHAGSTEYLLGLAELCRERGALLVVDEVQTGFGRTGRLFAIEHHGLEPDLLCMGKAMASGLPMGGVALGPRVDALPVGAHGSTFGGNALCSAAALATLSVLRDEALSERAARLGTEVRDELRALSAPVVREVRGLGLMIGIELKTRVTPYLKALMDRGVIALPAGPTVLRMLPPLTIPPDDLARALAILGEVLHGEPGA